MNKKELLAAGKCALKYPAGHGYSFFSDNDIDRSESASDRLLKDANCLKFG